ncbi:MAG: hypothetical protein M3Y33_10915 [Actinomycetota bacterium]|nr:hypothetical protein [Actinomycetota bacterium]
MADSEDAGLYDRLGEAPFERLPVIGDQRPEQAASYARAAASSECGRP